MPRKSRAGSPELHGACQWLVGFLEPSRSKMEGAQNRQLQYQKPTFSGLKGQQKRSGVAGPAFSMLKQNIAGESPKQGGGPRRVREVATRVAGRSQQVGGRQGGLASGGTKNQKCSNCEDIFRGPRRSQKRLQTGPKAGSGSPLQKRADAQGLRRSQSLPSRLPGGFTLPHRSVETLGRGPRSKPRAPMHMDSGALGSLGFRV